MGQFLGSSANNVVSIIDACVFFFLDRLSNFLAVTPYVAVCCKRNTWGAPLCPDREGCGELVAAGSGH